MKTVILILGAVSLLVAASLWKTKSVQSAKAETSTLTRLLLSLADTNTGLIEVRGTSNEIFFASDEACRILGYAKDELSGTNIDRVLPEEFRGVHKEKIRQAMSAILSNSSVPHVSMMRCVAKSKSGDDVDVFVRVFVSRNGIFALMNLAKDMHFFTMPGMSDIQNKAS